jgi:hypothetical protein
MSIRSQYYERPLIELVPLKSRVDIAIELVPLKSQANIALKWAQRLPATKTKP